MECKRFSDLVQSGQSISDPDSKGWLPLHYAAAAGDLECLKFLLSKEADPNVKTNEGTASATPLILACRNAVSKEVVGLLVEHGADPGKDSGFLEDTPLHEAVKQGRLDLVTTLVESGAAVNAISLLGDRALNIATLNNDFDIAKYLIENGAYLKSADYVDSPTLVAAENGNSEMLSFLIANGADINARTVSGETTFQIACFAGKILCVKILLEHGASPISGLHWADDPDIFMLLLEAMGLENIRKYFVRHEVQEVFYDDNYEEAYDKNERSLICIALNKRNKKCLKAVLNANFGKDVYEEPEWLELDITMQVDRGTITFGALKYGNVPPVSKLCMDLLYGEEDILAKLDILLTAGLSVNPVHKGSIPPLAALMYFSCDSDIQREMLKKCAEFLIERGADVDYQSKQSKFPGPDSIALACVCNPEALEFLLQYSKFTHIDVVRWCCNDIVKHFAYLNVEGKFYVEQRLVKALTICFSFGATGICQREVKNLESCLNTQPDLWKDVHSMIDSPCTLQQLSRLAIRESIKENVSCPVTAKSIVEKLELPVSMKEYVLYNAN